GIAAAALGASASGTPLGTAPVEALHTFTLDLGTSRYFFRDSTTLTPLPAPISVRLADPSRGSVVACSSTFLPCQAVPSGSLSGLHLPSFSTNMVAASAQVSASGQEAASSSCRLLSHKTLLWHHRLGHPSLPRLRSMHFRLLVSCLPRSLPPLPPSPAPPCLPCVEGRQRAAPHSTSFPPTTAPLQTLHMDVWGPARVSGQSRECYILLVVDDYTRYTTVFPLHSKSEVVDVLIPWIRTVRLQLRERFGQDLPVLRLHSDRGVMEVAHTSMIHAAAPHFLWPFAVRYTAHQLNLWPRVSLPETSPTLRWTGEVGDASVFRDVTFDESVPFYRLFPYRSAPPPPPPLFLASGPPPVDPLPPQEPAPSGVSQVDPLPEPAPVQVAAGSGAPWGAASGGAEPGSAESEGAETGGTEPGGVVTGGAEPEGDEPEGVEPGGAASKGVESRGAEPQGAASSGGSAGASPRLFWIGGAGAARAGGTGVAAGAGVTGGTATTGPRGARARGTGAAGTGGVEGAGAGDLMESGATGAGGAGVGGSGVRGAGAGGAGAIDPGGAPAFPLPAPSRYIEQSGGLTERREPASRPALPVRTAHRVPRSRPPPLPGTHAMTLRPSSVPLRAAMDAEMASWKSTGTYVDEVPPPRANIVDGMWIFRVKRPPGSPPAFKVRYVARGFSQRQGVDYFQSFSPTPKMTTVRVLLHVAAQRDYDPHLCSHRRPLPCPSPLPRLYDPMCLPPPHLLLSSTRIGSNGHRRWCLGMHTARPSICGRWDVWRRSSFSACRSSLAPPNLTCYTAWSKPWGHCQPPVAMLRRANHTAKYFVRTADGGGGGGGDELSVPIEDGGGGGGMGGGMASAGETILPPDGTHLAPREWHDTLRTTLAALGFAPATADPSLFLRTDSSLPPFYVLVYVDDLVFATADTEALTLVKSELQKRHTCTDLGELRSYLGLQITRYRARRTITLTQSHMVHQVLQRFGFQFSSPQPTPLSTSHSLSAPPSDESVEPSGLYPELVGCLMYLMTCT
ncbi:unnamed protein product, partial [Closterium sp. NIES-54]